jgi:hypothetical protein
MRFVFSDENANSLTSFGMCRWRLCDLEMCMAYVLAISY